MLKRLIALLLTLSALTVPSYAAVPEANDGIMPAYEGLNELRAILTISDTGLAAAVINYQGDADFHSISIKTKLQKKFMLVFWGDVANGETDHTWVDTRSSSSSIITHTLQLQEKGTYRIVVDITILTSSDIETCQLVSECVYE